jgi:hypothetical protein
MQRRFQFPLTRIIKNVPMQNNRTIIILVFLWISFQFTSYAQRTLGDNLGNHIATRNLDMNGNNMNNASVVNTENLVIGTVGKLDNSAIALQINGSNKAILVPRVPDLLNSSSPSIPISAVVEGMIVYDLTTHKFYIRDNSGWTTWGMMKLLAGQVLLGDSNGNERGVTLSGDVTLAAGTLLTTIGDLKITNAKLKGQSVMPSKIAPGSPGQFLKTNATGTAVEWVSSAFNYIDLVNRQTVLGYKSLASDSGFVLGGTFGAGALPITTEGSRMIWYPKKAAFMAGNISSERLTDANFGNYSAAFGTSQAPGSNSFAAGKSSASGANSAAFGNSSATDNYAIAGGSSNATGQYALAFGKSTASGVSSVAMGEATASGISSVALGRGATASGNYSVAIGRNANTNNFAGSFVFADATEGVANSNLANSFTARFSGGYVLYTNTQATVGVKLDAGATSWTMISDKRKKENFERANPETFLLKLDTMNVTSWNYKDQDFKRNRHYGPMAQDFYGAFGKDTYGAIGNDTTIATADIDGVNLIAVQGLVKRTNKLKQELDTLERSNANMETLIANAQLSFEAEVQGLLAEAQQKKDSLLPTLKRNSVHENSSATTLYGIPQNDREEMLKNKRSWYEAVAELIRKTVINANKR